MRALLKSPHGAGRDPVAVCIEAYLRAQDSTGRGRLSKKRKEDGVVVSFAEWTSIGEDEDIALVRLASLLLSDERFREGLVYALRHESPLSAASHELAPDPDCRESARKVAL